ncbi:MAG: glycosyltransferase [Pseudomonadota bacterium]
MRFLVFSTLYPNAAAPTHGVFVENRLRAFLRDYDGDVKVIAPVPWFPFKHARFGKYARFAQAPHREIRHGLDVRHPRYLIPPKAAMRISPDALASSLRQSIHQLTEENWDFDFIDAHYAYPDGVAATKIAAELGKPVVVTARGSDVTLIPDFAAPRARLLETMNKADALIAVAGALKGNMVALGANEQKIRVLRNGVDLDLFKPSDQARAKAQFNVTGPTIASVGHLVERKGHDLVIRAAATIPNVNLLIAGDGEERRELTRLANALNIADRVHFLGAIAHERLPDLYSASDLLVLASSREGWPNVLLEAMACGARCIATKAGGSAEVISSADAGEIVPERTSGALAEAITRNLQISKDRSAPRAHAKAHSWSKTTAGMKQIFDELTARSKRAASVYFREPLRSITSARPRLIVTVDTEELFDWRHFDSTSYSLPDTQDINAFQALCERENVKPHYFLSYPLLTDKKTSGYFSEKSANRNLSAGLHLHSWVTPPQSDSSGAYYSYQKNLSGDAQREKLNALIFAFEKAFGAQPLSHRAGRYGISSACYPILAECGITYDFSPSAAFDFSSDGGPDFSAVSNHPFVAETPNGSVYALPVCGARAIRHTSTFLNQDQNAPGLHTGQPQRRRNWTRPMRLSPEGAQTVELKALTKSLLASRLPILTFTLHSTSLTVGGNAYAHDKSSVDRILNVTSAYFDWFRSELDGEIIPFSEFAKLTDT